MGEDSYNESVEQISNHLRREYVIEPTPSLEVLYQPRVVEMVSAGASPSDFDPAEIIGRTEDELTQEQINLGIDKLFVEESVIDEATIDRIASETAKLSAREMRELMKETRDEKDAWFYGGRKRKGY